MLLYRGKRAFVLDALGPTFRHSLYPEDGPVLAKFGPDNFETNQISTCAAKCLATEKCQSIAFGPGSYPPQNCHLRPGAYCLKDSSWQYSH